jgi:phage-related protein (TIGR01555 family)
MAFPNPFHRFAAKPAPTRDSFQNFQAALGIGANNLSTGATYGQNRISRNRVLLEGMYRGSWIAGAAVDHIADDMTQRGIEITATDSPGAVETLHAAQTRLQIWTAFRRAIAWSRLYGGAVAVALIDGQDMSTPLDPSTVGKGQFKGLCVLDKWQVQASQTEVVTDLGPDLGKPARYYVVGGASALPGKNIHYTRLIRFDAVELPYWQAMTENGWGQSVLERLFDRLVAFDSTTQGAAQLVYKAHLRIWKMPGLRQLISTGGKLYEAVLKNIETVRLLQSSESITLVDGADDFQAQSYTFTGLDNVLLQFGQQLSGALEIPLVRLFGQSPAGLNSSGESDLRTYYDGIHKKQENQLRPGVSTVLDLISRSELGRPLDGKTTFEFRSLWQMSDKEKAEIGEITTRTVMAGIQEGVPFPVALKELRQGARTSGVWSNLSDQDIADAESAPPRSEIVPGGDDLSPVESMDEAASLIPTESMAEEARRGLAWRREFGRGGTEIGIARARDIANRKNLSPDTVMRMVSFFARHEVDKQGKGWPPGEDGYPSNGRIAWALWGGDAGKAWAEKMAKRIESEDEYGKAA